jgi:hypothetical protein
MSPVHRLHRRRETNNRLGEIRDRLHEHWNVPGRIGRPSSANHSHVTGHLLRILTSLLRPRTSVRSHLCPPFDWVGGCNWGPTTIDVRGDRVGVVPRLSGIQRIPYERTEGWCLSLTGGGDRLD